VVLSDYVLAAASEWTRCLALALVAPLVTHDCDGWHKIHLAQGDRANPAHNIERFSYPQHNRFRGREQLQPEFTKITMHTVVCDGETLRPGPQAFVYNLTVTPAGARAHHTACGALLPIASCVTHRTSRPKQ